MGSARVALHRLRPTTLGDLDGGSSCPRWDIIRSFCDDLLLVYGHAKTSAWNAIAFQQESRSGSVSFSLSVPAIGPMDIEYAEQVTSDIVYDKNHGPQFHLPRVEHHDSTTCLGWEQGIVRGRVLMGGCKRV